MKIQVSKNMAWGALIFGSMIEWIWVSGLKYADTFALHALTAGTIIASFSLMLIAVKKIEVSIAYSIFVGLGTAGVVISEILVFGEPFDMLKILFIFTLLLGVIGLKLVSKEDNDEKEIAKNLSHELGVDDIIQDSIDTKEQQ